MRNKFIKILIDYAKNNDNIYLLTGDLGDKYVEMSYSALINEYLKKGRI